MSMLDHSAPTPKQHAETSLSPLNADPVTGLGNRRYLNEQLEFYTLNEPGNFSLMIIDLDGFKTLNDTEGHLAGDNHLVLVARALEESTRSGKKEEDSNQISHTPRAEGDDIALDTLARIVRAGGDEFAVVLPGVNNEEKLDIIKERVQRKFAELSIKASIGAKIHEKHNSTSDLFRGADKRMYADKKARAAKAIEELPLRKRLAHRIGTKVLEYSGVKPQR